MRADALGVGAIELALATVGIYGILMFSVLARRREIGVRLALGARRSQASWVVMRPAIRHAATGIVVGVLGGLGVLFLMTKTVPDLVSGFANPLPYVGALLLGTFSVRRGIRRRVRRRWIRPLR